MSESADPGQVYGSPPRAFQPAKRSITGVDVAAVGFAFIAFIASFFPYVGFSGTIGDFTFSVSINAWHSYAMVGLFLLVGAGVAVVIGIAAASGTPSTAGGPAIPPAKPILDLVAACMAGLGTLLVVLRAFTYAGQLDVDWGGWILMIAGAAETVCAVASLLVLARRLRRDRPADDDGRASSFASYEAP